eukprot:TRINITY_DN68156_c5_g1_i12.p1 TRINITY_DN68156_c5_g1~~TRINITY_DN68156_c5_g1_i12.p1  ORF type:complete len:739 (-),score=80.80 TRINITY_DN68156_c5_g1_i12:116-2305(-)
MDDGLVDALNQTRAGRAPFSLRRIRSGRKRRVITTVADEEEKPHSSGRHGLSTGPRETEERKILKQYKDQYWQAVNQHAATSKWNQTETFSLTDSSAEHPAPAAKKDRERALLKAADSSSTGYSLPDDLISRTTSELEILLAEKLAMLQSSLHSVGLHKWGPTDTITPKRLQLCFESLQIMCGSYIVPNDTVKKLLWELQKEFYSAIYASDKVRGQCIVSSIVERQEREKRNFNVTSNGSSTNDLTGGLLPLGDYHLGSATSSNDKQTSSGLLAPSGGDMRNMNSNHEENVNSNNLLQNGNGGAIPYYAPFDRITFCELYKQHKKLEAQWKTERAELERQISNLKEDNANLAGKYGELNATISKRQTAGDLILAHERLKQKMRKAQTHNEYLHQQLDDLQDALRQANERFRSLCAHNLPTDSAKWTELIQQSNHEIRSVLHSIKPMPGSLTAGSSPDNQNNSDSDEDPQEEDNLHTAASARVVTVAAESLSPQVDSPRLRTASFSSTAANSPRRASQYSRGGSLTSRGSFSNGNITSRNSLLKNPTPSLKAALVEQLSRDDNNYTSLGSLGLLRGPDQQAALQKLASDTVLNEVFQQAHQQTSPTIRRKSSVKPLSALAGTGEDDDENGLSGWGTTLMQFEPQPPVLSQPNPPSKPSSRPSTGSRPNSSGRKKTSQASPSPPLARCNPATPAIPASPPPASMRQRLLDHNEKNKNRQPQRAPPKRAYDK